MDDFDSFVAAHVDELLRMAVVVCWDDREAEDLVQECLLRVARRWSRVRSMDRQVGYARRVLLNLAIDGKLHRDRRRAELENPARVVDVRSVEPLAGHAEREVLRAALADLPARQRAVLMLRFFDDLTEEQTADVLGCPAGTVKSAASRGLARLRQALASQISDCGSTEYA